MRYRVMHAGQPMGETRLEGRDPAMCVAFGAFSPLPAYEVVRPTFRIFAEATDGERTDDTRLAQYYRARDALDLSLVAEDGAIIPTDWIHIIDAAPWGIEGSFEVEVRVA